MAPFTMLHSEMARFGTDSCTVRREGGKLFINFLCTLLSFGSRLATPLLRPRLATRSWGTGTTAPSLLPCPPLRPRRTGHSWLPSPAPPLLSVELELEMMKKPYPNGVFSVGSEKS
jgi:hypothetical protein